MPKPPSAPSAPGNPPGKPAARRSDKGGAPAAAPAQDLDAILSRIEVLTAEEQRRRETAKAEASLYHFALQAWPILEPGRRFVDGWHIRAICAHLEAVANGRIKRLIINMPPRHMKSLLASVLFPLWLWLRNATKRFIVATYELPLGDELADKMRAVLRSTWFIERWGHRVKLKPGQDAVRFYGNDSTGYRYSTAVNAGGTGRGADVAILDDPHNTKKVEGEAERKNAHNFYHAVLSTRGNDPADFAIVIVMQRCHEDDLCGHLTDPEAGVEPGVWEQLILPGRYDGERRSTCLGEYDPRTEIGEPLWVERFPAAELNRLAASLGPYREAAQIDQKPTVPGGGLFKLTDFLLEDFAPQQLEVVRAWDIAATEEGASEDPDFTAGVLLGKDRDDELWLTDAVEERTDDPLALILKVAELDGPDVPIAIERQPAAAGKLIEASFKEALKGYTVRFYSTAGGKVNRASSWAGIVKQRRFHVLNKVWARHYLAQLAKFWQGRYDDFVDATSTGYASLLEDGGGYPNGGGGTVSGDDLNRLPGLRSGR